MQVTSLEAYHKNKRELGHKQARVFNSLYYSIIPLTNKGLSDRLGWPINTITPRVFELRKKGLVKEAYKRLTSTGRMAIAWRIRRPDEIHEQQMEMEL